MHAMKATTALVLQVVLVLVVLLVLVTSQKNVREPCESA